LPIYQGRGLISSLFCPFPVSLHGTAKLPSDVQRSLAVGKKLVSEIRQVADTFASIARGIRIARDQLTSVATQIDGAVTTLTTIANEIEAKKHYGELSVPEEQGVTKIKADRESKIRIAVNTYWRAKLIRTPKMTRAIAATSSNLESTALSKNGLPKCMKDIHEAIKKEQAVLGMQHIDSEAMPHMIEVAMRVLNDFLKQK